MQDNRLRRMQVPFERKGQCKLQPNNPRSRDGIVHDYCPPGHVRSELDKLFSYYADIRRQNVPTPAEATWLHHRFVWTHPFQDGNGRSSRLLKAHVYLRKGDIPPVITTAEKAAYIGALEDADSGNVRTFGDHIGGSASTQIWNSSAVTKRVLAGHQQFTYRNGGVTHQGHD